MIRQGLGSLLMTYGSIDEEAGGVPMQILLTVPYPTPVVPGEETSPGTKRNKRIALIRAKNVPENKPRPIAIAFKRFGALWWGTGLYPGTALDDFRSPTTDYL